MINQRPQRVFFSRWGLAYLEPFHLDSTFAASESHLFSRGSRRDSRDDVYRYGVFQAALRHHTYEFTSDLNLNPRFRPALTAESERWTRFLMEETGLSYSRRKIRFP